MYNELCGRGKSVFNVSSSPEDMERHRTYRKLLQLGLGSGATRGYKDLLEEQARGMLRRLESEPRKYETHVRRRVGLAHSTLYALTQKFTGMLRR